MSIAELFWVIGAILASAGGAVTYRLSNVQAAFQRHQLLLTLYFRGEFTLYKDLWLASSALHHSADRLWHEASQSNLQRFSATLRQVKPQLQRRAQLLEPASYRELMQALKPLETFSRRQRILSLCSPAAPQDITAFLQQHGRSREQIDGFNNQVLATLRGEVGGMTA